MRLEICKIQKGCMFVGAALFGSLTVGDVLWQELAPDPTLRPTTRSIAFELSGIFALLCYLVFVMVFGAWLGGAVSLVWRSPQGRRWFWMLSGGCVGGILATVGATYWTLAQDDATSRRSLVFE